MPHRTPVVKQFPLLLANADGHITQRWPILLLRFLAGHKRHLSALPDLGWMPIAIGLPLPFPNCLNRLMQSLTHPCTDGKADPPRWTPFPFLLPQPIHKSAFVASRVPPVVILGYRAREDRIGP